MSGCSAVLPPSAYCHQQQPALTQTDNTADMCLSQQQQAGALHQLLISPRIGRGKKLPGGSDGLFFLPISHNKVVPWGISRAEGY